MKRWTPSEDNILRSLYYEHRDREIGEKLGRSMFSVRKRALLLGLRKRTTVPVPWKLRDIQFLERNYAKLDNNAISKALNRSIPSLMWKAHELGLLKESRFPKNIAPLKEWQKGYIAAFLDGEGSVTLYKDKKYGFRANIEFTNTNKGVLETIAKWLGVKGSIFKKDSYAQNCLKLSISNHRVELWLLKQIAPYLIIKDERAKILKRYLEIRRSKLDKFRLHKISIQEARHGTMELELLTRFQSMKKRTT